MTLEDMKKLATLSRLDIPEAEMQGLMGDMEHILEYVRQIESADTTALPETTYLVKNILRDDMNPTESGTYTQVLLAEVPEREGNYVKVQQIL